MDAAINPRQTKTISSLQSEPASPENDSGDSVFHLAPFATCLHPYTVTPLYSAHPGSYHSPRMQKLSVRKDDDMEDTDSDCHSQNADGSDIVVPTPGNPTEAYLLLEAARADREVGLIRRNLALQIVRRNILALQYNRLLLEKTQDDLRNADRFVGQVRFVIRKSGVPVAFEYAAMQGGYSAKLDDNVEAEPRSSLDVTLD